MTKKIFLFTLLSALLLTVAGTANAHTAKNAGSSHTSALWVWETDAITNSSERSELFSFVKSKKINTIYLNVHGILGNDDSSLKDFMNAKSKSLQVEFLAGDAHWALSENHNEALEITNNFVDFASSLKKKLRPLALHLDIEPYTLDNWDQDEEKVATEYLDLLNECSSTLHSHNLKLNVDIPFWFDGVDIYYDGENRPLNEHVQSIVDSITIMDYRDFANGSDGMIENAKDEIAFANEIGKKVVIGVETDEVSPEKVTFYEEGETAMKKELGILLKEFSGVHAFAGTAIHHYESYKELNK
ncbi:MAG: hypothetical protein WC846_00010 [Candidatus Gracilibacteria bacterium]|jgi:hypothetical protein